MVTAVRSAWAMLYLLFPHGRKHSGVARCCSVVLSCSCPVFFDNTKGVSLSYFEFFWGACTTALVDALVRTRVRGDKRYWSSTGVYSSRASPRQQRSSVEHFTCHAIIVLLRLLFLL